jgi:hypothetical protein
VACVRGLADALGALAAPLKSGGKPTFPTSRLLDLRDCLPALFLQVLLITI